MWSTKLWTVFSLGASYTPIDTEKFKPAKENSSLFHFKREMPVVSHLYRLAETLKGTLKYTAKVNIKIHFSSLQSYYTRGWLLPWKIALWIPVDQ